MPYGLKKFLMSQEKSPRLSSMNAPAGLLLALVLSACASVGNIESTSQTMNKQAEVYENRARDLQKVGAGQAGVELRRLGDEQRQGAKRMETSGFVEGAVDMLLNSLLQSSSPNSPKFLKK